MNILVLPTCVLSLAHDPVTLVISNEVEQCPWGGGGGELFGVAFSNWHPTLHPPMSSFWLASLGPQLSNTAVVSLIIDGSVSFRYMRAEIRLTTFKKFTQHSIKYGICGNVKPVAATNLGLDISWILSQSSMYCNWGSVPFMAGSQSRMETTQCKMLPHMAPPAGESLLNHIGTLQGSGLAGWLLKPKGILIISIGELLLISICVEYPNPTHKGSETLACGGEEGQRYCFCLDWYQHYFPWCGSILLCVGMFDVRTVKWVSFRELFFFFKYTFFSIYL